MHGTLRQFGAIITVALLGCAHAPKPHAPDPTPSSEPITSSPTGGTEHMPGDEQCAATHGGECFASPDAACVAAGCANRQCEVLEGTPARVSCIDGR